MAPFGSHRTIGLMNKPDEQTSGKEAQEPEPSRLEEAWRIIEQYGRRPAGDHQETPPTLELKARASVGGQVMIDDQKHEQLKSLSG
jgi:hypothetical protein